MYIYMYNALQLSKRMNVTGNVDLLECCLKTQHSLPKASALRNQIVLRECPRIIMNEKHQSAEPALIIEMKEPFLPLFIPSQIER